MSDQFLFGRAWTLDIGAPNQTKATRYGNVGSNPAPIRISFDIDKNMTGTSNKSKITLTNLSPELRSNITKGYLLKLQAGYLANIDVLFVGNAFLVKNTRSGPDIMTEIDCGDGEGAITYCKLNKTYAGPQVPIWQILSDCAKAMEATTDLSPSGIQAGIALGIPNVYYPSFTAEGPVRKTLNRLLKPAGLEWNIQNGKLNIVPIVAHLGQQAQLVSPDTGLIQIPSVDKSGTTFTALLNPRLVPGALVKLDSQETNLSGYYKIRTSKFTGDSYGTSWEVACECTALPGGAVQQINEASTNSFNYQEAVA